MNQRGTMFNPKNDFQPAWQPRNESIDHNGSYILVSRPGGDVLLPHGFTGDFPNIADPLSLPADWTRLQIGTLSGSPVFLISAPPDAPSPNGLEWSSPRPFMGGLESGRMEALCRASMLASWDYDHRFCGRCGTATLQDSAEAARYCPACGHRAYPRVSPAMIVRIVSDSQAGFDGPRILLAHNRRFSENLYSCVAGFVESGENLERTVLREIEEEVGLKASPPRYLTSQAWPFPHSLMLGFETSAHGTPVPDGDEITDARWFSPDSMPQIPPHGTIARVLIDGWLETLV